MKYGYTYILTNKYRTVFYTGVTSDLSRRMTEHINGKGSDFCRRCNINILIYYELHINILDAIRREKQIKKWNRDWKIELIRKKNPEMKDLLVKNPA
jgi:putative endonuclease